MSDLLREIDEDVAKEKSEQFLEKWGLPIGVFLVIVVVGLFFFFNWQERAETTALSEANNFAEATTLMMSEPGTASALLTDLSASDSGFANLAQFKIGDSLWNDGEKEAAIAAWQDYILSPDANPELANTSRFKIAWFGNPYLESDEILGLISALESTPAYEAYGPVLRAIHAVSREKVAEAKAMLDGAEIPPGPARDLTDAVATLIKSL